jgi:hypothetical protein
MTSSIFNEGLVVRPINSGCLFSLNWIKSKFEGRKCYVIYYTENHHIYTIITDGVSWVKAPVTIRLEVGQEKSPEGLESVIEDAFFKVGGLVGV